MVNHLTQKLAPTLVLLGTLGGCAEGGVSKTRELISFMRGEGRCEYQPKRDIHGGVEHSWTTVPRAVEAGYQTNPGDPNLAAVIDYDYSNEALGFQIMPELGVMFPNGAVCQIRDSNFFCETITDAGINKVENPVELGGLRLQVDSIMARVTIMANECKDNSND